MEIERNAITYHDALAEGWERRYGRGGFASRAHFFARTILPLLPSSGRWLDAGCGSGTFSRMLMGQGRSVVGVDASLNMVEEAKKQKDPSSRLSFHSIETIEHLPFQDGYFDGIICLSVLEYLERPLAALEEMGRVLKRGGVVAFSVPHRSSALRAAQKMYRRFLPAETDRSLGYLDLSLFTTEPKEMERAANSFAMKLCKTVSFDPILPQKIHTILKPSLFYMICKKTN